MICKRPFVRGLAAYPCGQCLPCRINRRRVWTLRVLLEQRMHAESCFVTLTYDDQHVPEGGDLCPEDLTNYLKRLRVAWSPLKLRYLACGEYGDQGGRPHFHICLFGLGLTRESMIRAAWTKQGVPIGHVDIRELAWETAQYCVAYTLKGSLREAAKDTSRKAEFVRMSLRPGIGAAAMKQVAGVLFDAPTAEWLCEQGDVPSALSVGRRTCPLGRYLRGRLREEYGGESAAPLDTAWSRAQAEEVSGVREALGAVGRRNGLVAAQLVDWDRVDQAEYRHTLRKGRKL